MTAFTKSDMKKLMEKQMKMERQAKLESRQKETSAAAGKAMREYQHKMDKVNKIRDKIVRENEGNNVFLDSNREKDEKDRKAFKLEENTMTEAEKSLFKR